MKPPANDNSGVRVYVLEDVHSHIVKVGISYDPVRRADTIMGAYPAFLRVAHQTRPYSRSRARQIEMLTHESLGNWALGREWFSCPAALAIEVLGECGGDSPGEIL